MKWDRNETGLRDGAAGAGVRQDAGSERGADAEEGAWGETRQR